MFDVIFIQNEPYCLSVNVCDNTINCQLSNLAVILFEDMVVSEFLIRVKVCTGFLLLSVLK